MLIDSTLTLAAGLIAAGSNKQCKLPSVVIFISFAMLQVYSDIFLKILMMTNESAVYIAYATIQICVLIAFNRLKVNKILKFTTALNLITNSLVIFHYIIVSNFGEMVFNFHTAYNPIIWSLMITQLLILLWMEKNVVIFIRKQGYALWNYCSATSLVRVMRSSWYANRGSK